MTNNPSNKVAIAIIAGLFFIFGFITWVNGALIPFMKTINELTEAQSYLVASASYISFVVMALPASYLLQKIGYRMGMSVGLFIMALGALVFIPRSSNLSWWNCKSTIIKSIRIWESKRLFYQSGMVLQSPENVRVYVWLNPQCLPLHL